MPRPFTMPWGSGQIVEEAAIETRWHEPAIQLLRFDDGSESLRFCYYHGSRFGRGPTMVDADALADFAGALKSAPRIRELLLRMLGAELELGAPRKDQ